MNAAYNPVAEAKRLLADIGVRQLSEGIWELTDTYTASQAYIHHTQKPAALAAYAAVNDTFAAGRFPGYTLVALVDKMPSLDYAEYTAMAMACGSPLPSCAGSDVRARIFGNAVWSIVSTYKLEGCFERHNQVYQSNGDHYSMRPRGYNWGGDWGPIPESLKAMRKCYRAMTPVQQIMVLTIIHLYHQGKDKSFLTGGCPTQILAAKALSILRHAGALPDWGHLVTHYAGW
jgi:hypothetical protein